MSTSFVKRGMALLIALLMAGGLVACKPSTPASSGSSESGTSTGTSGDPNDYQQNDFRMMAWWDSTAAPGSETEKLQKEIAAQYNIREIKTISVPLSEYMTRLTSELSTGNPPDICWTTSDMLVSLVNNDSLAPLDDFDLAQSKVFVPQYSDAAKINGKRYALTSDTYPEGILYNKTLIKNAGFEDPWDLYNAGNWTWDNFYKIAKGVTQSSKSQYGFVGGYSFANVYCQTAGFLYTNGSTPVKDVDGKKVFAMDDPSQLEALQFIEKLFTGTTAVVNPEEISEHMLTDSFKSGKVAFAASFGYDVEVNLKKATVAFDYALVPYPKGPKAEKNSSPMRSGGGVACPKGTRNPMLALKIFEEYLLAEKKPAYMDLDGKLDEAEWAKNFTRGQLYFSDAQLSRMCQTDAELENVVKLIDTQVQTWEGSYGLTELMTELMQVVVEGKETPASAVQSRKSRAQEIIDLALGQ